MAEREKFPLLNAEAAADFRHRLAGRIDLEFRSERPSIDRNFLIVHAELVAFERGDFFDEWDSIGEPAAPNDEASIGWGDLEKHEHSTSNRGQISLGGEVETERLRLRNIEDKPGSGGFCSAPHNQDNQRGNDNCADGSGRSPRVELPGLQERSCGLHKDDSRGLCSVSLQCGGASAKKVPDGSEFVRRINTTSVQPTS